MKLTSLKKLDYYLHYYYRLTYKRYNSYFVIETNVYIWKMFWNKYLIVQDAGIVHWSDKGTLYANEIYTLVSVDNRYFLNQSLASNDICF
jgi:hypothetical protein